MAGNVVVFFDGTGHERGTRYNATVCRLFHIVEDRTGGPVTLHDRGPGGGLRRHCGKPVIQPAVSERMPGTDERAATADAPWIQKHDYDVWQRGPL